ncbi:hypothetical protein F2Q69_00001190 [Brassica cretica]|uniref:Uncharacterized protein n=2 Tax=Brassica cretica TaxID=69181 RepID=A0ABQ7CJ97_BRACR|nr:hypothetical protein F2Q69_00001190 [Brassica cretica]KAF3551596.1 hypothetical protein DY000_02001282 [Brassica cretica]
MDQQLVGESVIDYVQLVKTGLDFGQDGDGEASCSNKKPKETKENKERLAKSKEDKRGIKDKKSKSGNVEDPSKERKSKRRRDLNGRWKLLKLGKRKEEPLERSRRRSND